MAPLDPNATARVYVDYEVAGYEHTLIARFTSAGNISDTVSHMADLIIALNDQLYASTLVGLRASNAGSGVSYPISETFPTDWGDGTAVGNETAQFYDFVGRSVDGRRVRAALFGAKIVSNNDVYRLPYSLGGLWADAIDALDTSFPSFCTISGQAPTWHRYINTGINAYWRNKIR